ncbi:MAG: response regulator transcription factor [Burkholderiaceae bacterium]|nr:response regulator transcription factor [Burkholderiaceae bacterium]
MSAAKVPIALVEDQPGLRAEIGFHLALAGYAVAELPHGAALDAHLRQHPCRLVVLDLGLPGEDGLSVCARLRDSHPDLGIVILTGRGMAQERVAGWRQGADAYLVKPAVPAELQAVVAGVLRRLPAGAAPAPAPALWTLRLRSRILAGPGHAVLELTHAECALLQALAQYAPEPASRRVLVAALGGDYMTYEAHRLEVAVSRLRGKLAQAWPEGETIRAARGVGYLLTRRCALAET